MWPENPKKHHVEIIVLALTLRIKCFSCNLIYPKSPRLKKRASRKHFEASVEKREPQGTFLSLGLQPRLQKTFLRFPFFYLSNLGKTKIRRGQIFPQSSKHNYRNKILFLLSIVPIEVHPLKTWWPCKGARQ